jgi:hypothetical protein
MNPHYPFVANRANHRCEYCRAPEEVFNLVFEIEHIIALALGGLDDESNLALACRACNLFKLAFIIGFDQVTGTEVRNRLHSRLDGRRTRNRAAIANEPAALGNGAASMDTLRSVSLVMAFPRTGH